MTFRACVGRERAPVGDDAHQLHLPGQLSPMITEPCLCGALDCLRCHPQQDNDHDKGEPDYEEITRDREEPDA